MGAPIDPLHPLQNIPADLLEDPTDVAAQIRRVLVVGVSSYLGAALAVGLREEFETFGTYHDHAVRIDGVTCFEMDCTEGGAILDALKKIKPDAVLYCAGLGDPDVCQGNAALAESLHFKAPTIFFRIIPIISRFIYFSTDEVYGGNLENKKPPFDESVPAMPLSVYSRTKSQGESTTLSHRRYTSVLRLGSLFGEGFGVDHRGHRWFDDLRSHLARKEKVQVYDDQIRSFTYIGDVVRAVRLYLRKSPIQSELYNLASPTAATRLEFAQQMCHDFGFDANLLEPIHITQDRKVRTPRAANAALNPKKFQTEFGFKFQPLKESMAEFAERMRTGFTRGWSD